MGDFKLVQGSDGRFDIAIENGDIANEDGFDTAIYVSLFTDARAPEAKVFQPENRRGWLGNLVSPVEGRELGGLRWLTEQRRLTQSTLNEVVSYDQQALDWFVEDEIAKNIAVSGEIIPQSGIALTINITATDGKTENYYIPLWEATGQEN